MLILNFFIVRYYVDKSNFEVFPVIVSVASLTITLLCVFLIPVDIYSVSTGESEFTRTSIRILYLILYCLVLIVCFGVIPFAWFYYDAYDAESDSTVKRLIRASKYTIGFVVAVVILLVIGIFIRADDLNSNDAPDVWANKILAQGRNSATLSFTIACVTVLGYLVWCTYTAIGLSFLPLGLIKGRKSIEEDKKELHKKKEQLKKQRERSDDLEETELDNSTAEFISDEVRVLQKRALRLEQIDSRFEKILGYCRPFSVVFGVIFLLLSLLLVISISLTALDRTLHHINCGFGCGFILQYPEIFNPLDKLLIVLAKFFPLDYIVLSIIIMYVYFCTLHAITEIGVKCFCLHMFKFQKDRTEPRALLMTSILLMLSTLALNNSIVTLAPTYSNFGSQTYISNTTNTETTCSMDSPSCETTQLGTLVHGVQLNVKFIGVIFYCLTWIFVLIYFIGLIVACVRKKKSNVEEYSDDDEEEENWN
uniref:LMBR1-like conserved region-containing protein n=1 Tax=Arcella intermedia TaxID=1963864 RepID=A0A6B2L2H5_9EUKA